MARGRCEGAAAAHWAKRARILGGCGGSDGAGHIRAAYGDMTWCVKCGAYAVAHAVGLAAPCKGRPDTPSQNRVRNRLLLGRHPRTNAVIGLPLLLEAPKEHHADMWRKGAGAGATAWAKGGSHHRAAGYIRRPGGKSIPYAGRSWMPEEGEALMDFKRRRRAAEVPLATFRLPEEEMKEILEKANRARVEEEGGRADMVSAWKEASEVGIRSGVGHAASDRSEGASQVVEPRVEEERSSTQRTRKDLLASLRREASAARKHRTDML